MEDMYQVILMEVVEVLGREYQNYTAQKAFDVAEEITERVQEIIEEELSNAEE